VGGGEGRKGWYEGRKCSEEMKGEKDCMKSERNVSST
jgi:hypothetical protein